MQFDGILIVLATMCFSCVSHKEYLCIKYFCRVLPLVIIFLTTTAISQIMK